MGTESDGALLKSKLNHIDMLTFLMMDLSTLNVAG